MTCTAKTALGGITRGVLVLLGLLPAHVRAQAVTAEPVVVKQLAPRFHLISTAQAHLLVFIDDTISVALGVHSPALTARARALVKEVGAPAVRYALLMEHDSAPGYGDGGWGRRGAVTLSHEMLYVRMRRAAQDTAATAARMEGQALPAMGFSRVVQLFLLNDEAHIVHDRAGATDAEVIVHFEREGLLLLGGMFTNDGYPVIDLSRGGSLLGMIKWLDWFADNFGADKVEPIIPGRGPVATLADLQAYRRMIVTVRDRITALRQEGKTVDQIVQARPTAEFDDRWGRGPVAPADFVRMMVASLPR